jgi:hypothetical protein
MASNEIDIKEIEIIYCGWNSNAILRRITLPIPGVGGTDTSYDRAQPWQCKPFIDGNTAGFEIFWHLPEVIIESQDGITAQIEDTWSEITRNESSISQFADGHVGINTGIKIKMPYGWGGLILPHPEWFHDPYNTDLPCMVPGVLEFDWWSNFFFVVSKVPPLGKKYILKPNKPFCQIIPMPIRQKIKTRKATEEEAKELNQNSDFITNNYSNISTHSWTTKSGSSFGNVYKIISNEIRKQGKIDWDEIKKSVIKNNN